MVPENAAQFKNLNGQLRLKYNFKYSFSAPQRKNIDANKTPSGYTWHQ